MRRVGLVVLPVVCVAIGLMAAPSASAATCTATALRVTGPTGTYESARANPAGDPCVDSSVRESRTRIVVGGVEVTSTGLNAATDDDAPDPPPAPPGRRNFERATADADSVTIRAGANTITAKGAYAEIQFWCDRLFCYPPWWTTLTYLEVNGVNVSPGAGQQDVPVPGVGTLHVDWHGGPPATARALWLEGAPGMPDVVVGEAMGCQTPFGCGTAE